MPKPLVAADLHLATDVGLDLAAEVTLDLVVGLDVLTQLGEVVVAQVLGPQVRADALTQLAPERLCLSEQIASDLLGAASN